MAKSYGTYGFLAEFDTPTELVLATKKAYAAGYRNMDAYSPFPIEEVGEALGLHKNRVSLIVLIGGILGGMAGYSLEYWVSVIAYPLNVGGKPFHSWPAFIPVTFELTVLGAALSATLGMFLMNGLPRPYHPVFNAPNFRMSASKDKFFLSVEAEDPKYHAKETREFLESLEPVSVTEVEN